MRRHLLFLALWRIPGGTGSVGLTIEFPQYWNKCGASLNKLYCKHFFHLFWLPGNLSNFLGTYVTRSPKHTMKLNRIEIIHIWNKQSHFEVTWARTRNFKILWCEVQIYWINIVCLTPVWGSSHWIFCQKCIFPLWISVCLHVLQVKFRVFFCILSTFMYLSILIS